MTGRSLLSALLVVGLVLVAGDAEARRKKGRSRSKAKAKGPPSLVVAPFEGHGAKSDQALARSLELELELVETVKVTRPAGLAKDLKKKKEAAFEAAQLKGILKKRKVDILVRGVKGWTDEGASVTWVLLYDGSGEARFMEAFEIEKDTDSMAQAIAAGISPAFGDLSSRDAVEVVFPEKPKPRSDSDLFVDGSDVEKGEDGGRRSRVAGGGDSAEPKPRKSTALDEVRSAKRKDERPRERPSLGSERRDGATDEPPGKLDDDAGRSDGDGDEAPAGDGDKKRLGDDAAEGDPEATEEAAPSLTHFIAVSASIGGGALVRTFQASRPAQSEPLFWRGMLSAGARLSFWPIEWVGVDADLRADGVRFTVDPPVEPQQFFTARVSAGAAAKARYVLHLGPVGVGGGFRIGGRYNGMPYVPEQRSSDGDLLTLVPSYHWYNFVLGPELFFSLVVFGRRIELEPKIEVAPFAALYEGPDWPGKTNLTVGWMLQTAARAEIFYGAFVELYAWQTGGWTNWFGGAGTRRGRLINNQSGEREYIQGGVVMNLDGGAQLGVGWMW